MNSKQKGKRGELEFSRFCKEHGYETKRTAQYCGNTGDAADVEGLPGIHIEVKRCEQIRLGEWMEQAVRDSHGNGLPIVAHRRNGCPWMVSMLADGWFKLYSAWENTCILIKNRVKYAQGKLDESVKTDDEVGIDYWRGYIDGVKAVERDMK